MSPKRLVYLLARACGLFALARSVTRSRVRVLAYHGFATSDEASFRPKLFISAATFSRRLKLLREWGFRVATLDQLADSLETGVPLVDAVVITIDDGFVSTLRVAAPVLREAAMPATVYLTTYHVKSQTPVFDLAVGYLIWKTSVGRATLESPLDGSRLSLELRSHSEREQSLGVLLDIGHRLASEDQRGALRAAIARELGLEGDPVASGDAFRLMSIGEAKQLADFGVDLGLHTHRHRFPPDDLVTCARELADNREFLSQIVARRQQHFCYPSGIYGTSQAEVLRAAGIRTATTCDTGLVSVDAPKFELKRFLDGEQVSDLEFEAEMSGFADLARRALRVHRAVGGMQAR